MGRIGEGVEVRANSIRISVAAGGHTARGTLTLVGKPIKPTPANLKYAARVAAEIREKLRHGTYRASDYFPVTDATHGGTVGAALDRWLKTQAVTDSTRRGYETSIRAFWKPEIGDRMMAGLRKSDVLLALANRPDWTGKTRNNKLAVLRPALDLAVADGIITANPCDGIDPFKHQKPPVDPFTGDERDAILEHFRRHAPAQVYAYFATMFWTGLRTSEGLGLQWGQVELSRRKLTVVAGLVEGKMTDRTKTGATRTVDLNRFAEEALRVQEPFSRMAGGVVFTHPATGKGWTREQQTWAIWQRALLGLGIRYRRPYNTRHTYATTMLMAGMTPAYVARQLGHSVQVLLSAYAKWVDGDSNEREQAKLDQFVSSLELPRAPGDGA